MCSTLTVFESHLLLRGGHETAGGQLHKSNRRYKEMGFEVVMVMRAL